MGAGTAWGPRGPLPVLNMAEAQGWPPRAGLDSAAVSPHRPRLPDGLLRFRFVQGPLAWPCLALGEGLQTVTCSGRSLPPVPRPPSGQGQSPQRCCPRCRRSRRGTGGGGRQSHCRADLGPFTRPLLHPPPHLPWVSPCRGHCALGISRLGGRWLGCLSSLHRDGAPVHDGAVLPSRRRTGQSLAAHGTGRWAPGACPHPPQAQRLRLKMSTTRGPRGGLAPGRLE